MTRSVTITNTSNWDHEDYSIDLGADGEETITLKPGESIAFTPSENRQAVITEDDSRGEAKPFRKPAIDPTDGKYYKKQVYPTVTVEFK